MSSPHAFHDEPWFGEPPAVVYLIGSIVGVLGPLVLAFLLAV